MNNTLINTVIYKYFKALNYLVTFEKIWNVNHACNFCMCVHAMKDYPSCVERSQHDFYQHAVFFQSAFFTDTTTYIKYTFYVERKNGRNISSMEESYKKILQNGRDLHNLTILHIGMERQEATSYG